MHMLQAWRPLLFCDEDQQAKATRDPVAPAKRSKVALRKAHLKTLDAGSEVHRFYTLLLIQVQPSFQASRCRANHRARLRTSRRSVR